jgi:hypothetical protein
MEGRSHKGGPPNKATARGPCRPSPTQWAPGRAERGLPRYPTYLRGIDAVAPGEALDRGLAHPRGECVPRGRRKVPPAVRRSTPACALSLVLRRWCQARADPLGEQAELFGCVWRNC